MHTHLQSCIIICVQRPARCAHWSSTPHAPAVAEGGCPPSSGGMQRRQPIFAHSAFCVGLARHSRSEPFGMDSVMTKSEPPRPRHMCGVAPRKSTMCGWRIRERIAISERSLKQKQKEETEQQEMRGRK